MYTHKSGNQWLMDQQWLAALISSMWHCGLLCLCKIKLQLFVLANLKLMGSEFQLNPIICAKLKSLTNPSSMPGDFTEKRAGSFCNWWEAAQVNASTGPAACQAWKGVNQHKLPGLQPSPGLDTGSRSTPWSNQALLCRLHNWSHHRKTRKGETTELLRLKKTS